MLCNKHLSLTLTIFILLSACQLTTSSNDYLSENSPRFIRESDSFDTMMTFGWEKDTNETEVRLYYTFIPIKDLNKFVTTEMLDSHRDYTWDEILPYIYTLEEDNHGTYLEVSPLDSEPDFTTIFDKNQFPLFFEWGVEEELDPIFEGRALYRNQKFDTSPAPNFFIRGFLSQTDAPGSNDKNLAEPAQSSPFRKLGFTHDDAIHTIIIIIYNDADNPDLVRIHYLV